MSDHASNHETSVYSLEEQLKDIGVAVLYGMSVYFVYLLIWTPLYWPILDPALTSNAGLIEQAQQGITTLQLAVGLFHWPAFLWGVYRVRTRWPDTSSNLGWYEEVRR